MSNCSFCGKELKQNDKCWHISECAEDYCYQDIINKADLRTSCIGRELIECGYSEEYILNIFKQPLDERDIDIYYTTVEE
ncbi:MAG: hypothetical protein LKF87_14590 [Clostridium tyrobutyricum]|jgi:hypothetical protein|uniref:hypothetical protein n=1 Tax=Clostridium tyrobutyricum TaxID=1519 RepID=UPI00242F3D5E|nr:hypothetical protein [Clostridium tyrobutyricum]MCH4200650.1 hypothetical protein [Clostridium tyrobutyricum]MCH4237548.1 hypothetical protein [Clostridium tyrobutyricum]MCH4260141.1 hypothetical protein [Clostridium tyrobutyricum]MCI2011749.1 hypothetical protein [Clostridium tyrobutyricum]